jgi:transposase
MPKLLRARPAYDEQEERLVRKLAASRHGPADWIIHAKIVVRSWDGERVETIAQELDCSPPTVRRRLHRFDVKGTLGLGDRPRTGRPRRLTAEDDSRILALARSTPPGKLKRLSSGELDVRDEQGAAHWSLNALAGAAQEGGNKAQTQPGSPHLPDAQECAGVERTVGGRAMIKILSQKGSGRQPLH